MAEHIREYGGSSFYSSEEKFDGTPILVYLMLELEPVAMEGRLQPRSKIDGNDCASDLMPLAERRKEHLGHCLVSRRIEPHTQQAVRVSVDRGV